MRSSVSRLRSGWGGSPRRARLSSTLTPPIARGDPRAGLGYPRFRDPQRTAAIRLFEVDCTDPEIAAITGPSRERTRQILEIYLSRTPEIARNAMAKWESKSGLGV